jgi:hypothetical protein
MNVRINRQATVHTTGTDSNFPACGAVRYRGSRGTTFHTTTDAVTCTKCLGEAPAPKPVEAPAAPARCTECGCKIPASGSCLICE